MLKDIVKFIKQAISEIEQIKHFDLWNRQIFNEKLEKPFWTPAVFLNFDSILWDVSTGKTGLDNTLFNQKGKIQLTLWVIFESKKGNLETFENLISPIRILILTKLNLKPIPGIGILIRSEEEYDDDHDNVIFWKISFVLDVLENIKDEDLQEAFTNFELELDLAIDDKEIRSGKLE